MGITRIIAFDGVLHRGGHIAKRVHAHLQQVYLDIRYGCEQAVNAVPRGHDRPSFVILWTSSKKTIVLT